MHITVNNRDYIVEGDREQMAIFIRDAVFRGHLVWDAAEVSGVKLTLVERGNTELVGGNTHDSSGTTL